MKKNRLKKVLIWTFSVLLFLIVATAVHIYMVYRPKAPDAYTKIMARIDIKQPITQDDANKITTWMFQQKGIDHVMINPKNSIVIFTFFPLKTSGNQIVSDFKANFHMQANRFMPTAENLKHSCPMAASSFTYKIYKVISQII